MNINDLRKRLSGADDLNDYELADMYAQSAGMSPARAYYELGMKQPGTSSIAEDAYNVGVDAVQGIGHAAGGLVGLAGLIPGVHYAADPLGRAISGGTKWVGDQLHTQDWLREEGQMQAAIKAAADRGLVEGGVEAFDQLRAHPRQAFGMAASSIPQMIAGGALARGVNAAKVGLGGAALSPAVAAAIGEGIQAGGSVSGDIAQNPDNDFAARYYGVPAGAITGAISRGASRLMPAGDLDEAVARRMMGGMASNAERELAGSAPVNLLSAVPRAVFREGVLEEGFQSPNEAAWTNVAEGRPWDYRLGAEAVQGAVTGGLFGVGGGVTNMRREMSRRGLAEQLRGEGYLPQTIDPAGAQPTDLLAGLEARDYQNYLAPIHESALGDLAADNANQRFVDSPRSRLLERMAEIEDYGPRTEALVDEYRAQQEARAPLPTPVAETPLDEQVRQQNEWRNMQIGNPEADVAYYNRLMSRATELEEAARAAIPPADLPRVMKELGRISPQALQAKAAELDQQATALAEKAAQTKAKKTAAALTAQVASLKQVADGMRAAAGLVEAKQLRAEAQQFLDRTTNPATPAALRGAVAPEVTPAAPIPATAGFAGAPAETRGVPNANSQSVRAGGTAQVPQGQAVSGSKAKVGASPKGKKSSGVQATQTPQGEVNGSQAPKGTVSEVRQEAREGKTVPESKAEDISVDDVDLSSTQVSSKAVQRKAVFNGKGVFAGAAELPVLKKLQKLLTQHPAALREKEVELKTKIAKAITKRTELEGNLKAAQAAGNVAKVSEAETELVKQVSKLEGLQSQLKSHTATRASSDTDWKALRAEFPEAAALMEKVHDLSLRRESLLNIFATGRYYYPDKAGNMRRKPGQTLYTVPDEAVQENVDGFYAERRAELSEVTKALHEAIAELEREVGFSNVQALQKLDKAESPKGQAKSAIRFSIAYRDFNDQSVSSEQPFPNRADKEIRERRELGQFMGTKLADAAQNGVRISKNAKPWEGVDALLMYIRHKGNDPFMRHVASRVYYLLQAAKAAEKERQAEKPNDPPLYIEPRVFFYTKDGLYKDGKVHESIKPPKGLVHGLYLVGKDGVPELHISHTGNTTEVVLHELIHHGLAGYIASNPNSPDVKALEDLRAQVVARMQTDAALPASLKSLLTELEAKGSGLQDFLAYGLTHHDFQKYMKTAPGPKEGTAAAKYVKHAWSAFTTLVRRMLGIREDEATAFNAFLSLSGDILSYSKHSRYGGENLSAAEKAARAAKEAYAKIAQVFETLVSNSDAKSIFRVPRLDNSYGRPDKAFSMEKIFDAYKGEGWTLEEMDEYRLRFVNKHSDVPITKGWYMWTQDGNATITENAKGEINISTPTLNTGKSEGWRAVTAAMAYAYHNGKVFTNEEWETSMSPLAIVRYTEAMLSAALKFGTTDFMRPHRLQINAKNRKEWEPGDKSIINEWDTPVELGLEGWKSKEKFPKLTPEQRFVNNVALLAETTSARTNWLKMRKGLEVYRFELGKGFVNAKGEPVKGLTAQERRAVLVNTISKLSKEDLTKLKAEASMQSKQDIADNELQGVLNAKVVSTNKLRVYTPSGVLKVRIGNRDVAVLVNPTLSAVQGMANKLIKTGGALRALNIGGLRLIWDAHDATHHQVFSTLGKTADDMPYNDFMDAYTLELFPERLKDWVTPEYRGYPMLFEKDGEAHLYVAGKQYVEDLGGRQLWDTELAKAHADYAIPEGASPALYARVASGDTTADISFAKYAPSTPWLEGAFRAAFPSLWGEKNPKLMKAMDSMAAVVKKDIQERSPTLAKHIGYWYAPFNVTSELEQLVQIFKKQRSAPATAANEFGKWVQTRKPEDVEQVMEAFAYMDDPSIETSLTPHVKSLARDAREALLTLVGQSKLSEELKSLNPSEMLTLALQSENVAASSFGAREGKLFGSKFDFPLAAMDYPGTEVRGKFYQLIENGVVKRMVHESIAKQTPEKFDMTKPYLVLKTDKSGSKVSGEPVMKFRALTTARSLLSDDKLSGQTADKLATSFLNTVSIMANAVATRKLAATVAAVGDGQNVVFDDKAALLAHLRKKYPGKADVTITKITKQEAKNKHVQSKLREPGNWVQMPDSDAYGELKGKVVEGPVWARIQDALNHDPVVTLHTYNQLVALFKKMKTAYNPATAATNVMSNFTLAYLHNISGRTMKDAMSLYLRYKSPWHVGRMKEGSDDLRIMSAFHKSGATLGDFSTNEIRQLMHEAYAESFESSGVGYLSELAKWTNYENSLRQKVVEYAKRTGKKVDDVMVDAYATGDNMFRLAAFLHEMGRLERENPGMPMDARLDAAGTFAKKAFLDYDIDARAIQALRQTLLPFVAWPYAFSGVMAKIIKEQPWKVATLALAYTLVTAAFGAGEDDEDEKMRKREKKDSKTWFGADKEVRWLKTADGRNYYFNAARWFMPTPLEFKDAPNGFFGFHSFPSAMTPNNPIMTSLIYAYGLDPYTGKPLSKDTATDFDRAGAVVNKLAGQFLPPWANADKLGGPNKDLLGQDRSTALHYTKLLFAPISEVDPKESRLKLDIEIKRTERAFDTEMSSMKRAMKAGRKDEAEVKEALADLKTRKAERLKELKELR